MDKVLTLEEMHNMNIDNIIDLYRNGYTIEENVNNLEPKIVSADISVSTGSLFLIGAAALVYLVFLRR